MKSQQVKTAQPDVHQIAADFLESYARGQALIQQPIAESLEEVLTVENPKCIIVRQAKPMFLVGVKKNGEPVWTYELRLAAEMSEDEAHTQARQIPDALVQWATS